MNYSKMMRDAVNAAIEVENVKRNVDVCLTEIKTYSVPVDLLNAAKNLLGDALTRLETVSEFVRGFVPTNADAATLRALVEENDE